MSAVPPDAARTAFFDRYPVSRETEQALDIYARLLDEWQGRLNLVGPATLPDKWHRHFLDSAQLLDYLPETARTLADLGSGAGFPGLVLAIMTDLKVTLVESRAKKCRFLQAVADACGIAARVSIANIRVEELPPVPFDVITARAFAPLGRLLGWSRHIVSPQTVMLLPKGASVAEEIAEARKTFLFDASLHTSVTEPAAHIVELRNVRARSATRGSR